MFLNNPGEHSILIPGSVGQIETIVSVPQHASHQYIMILGHPHSLQGGTMHNKVVTTLARVSKELGIISVRFNFRGVGQSSGVYDHGVGESVDMLSVIDYMRSFLPNAEICLAGFSFGSYVAYRTAAHFSHAALLLVAPPIHHYDYREWSIDPNKTKIFQGDLDEVCPLSFVLDYAAEIGCEVLRFPQADHFFHRQLIILKDQLLHVLRPMLQL